MRRPSCPAASLALPLLALALAGCGRFQARPAVPLEPPGWATQGGGVARTSGDGSAVTFPLRLTWAHDAGRAVHAPPALTDSVAVVATLDRRLMAYRLEDGERRWIRADRGGYEGGLVAAGRYLYAGTDGREGLLRCLELDTGRPRWALACGAVMSAPFAGDSLLLVAADPTLMAVDRVTGETRWRVPVPSPVIAAPLLADSLVVAASAAGSLGAWSLADGSARWSLQAGRGVRAALGLSPDGRSLFLGSLEFGVECRDPQDGAPRWRAPMEAGCRALCVAGEDVAALGPDGTLVLLRGGDGSRLWRVSVPGIHEAALAVSGDHILTGGRDGVLRAFRTADGAAAGEWDAGEPILCPPAVSRSRVLVCGSRGLVALLASAPSPDAGAAVAAALPAAVPGEPAPSAGVSPGAAPLPLLVVRSAPPGAAVARGGETLGETPFSLPLAAIPGDPLLFTLPGHEPVSLAAERLLEPGPASRPRLDALPRGAGAAGRERARGSWTKRATISFAASLLSGGAAVWFRGRADDAYARYRRSSDPAEIERHYDEAVRQDRLFAASWMGCQAGLAAAVYSLIRRDLASEAPAPPERGWSER